MLQSECDVLTEEAYQAMAAVLRLLIHTEQKR